MSATPTGTAVPAQIGPYRVEREIARGGMGIVYLARDTHLDRFVAIKALPDDVASDPERLARFEREAKTLASLHHPNIAGIYGVEMAGGRRYLVLEHVEGETLATRLSRGKLPVAEAVELCAQIAAGVEAAHESGVIHRDLKPGNVMITPDDQARVLDFGLAKGRVAEPSSGVLPNSPTSIDSPTLSSPTLPHSPTIISPATMPGVILGTAAYLSPEQARGKAVDRRTDIWSFGCVLYECLTGKRVFEGETVSDTIAKILERDVDWKPLPSSTPPRLRELLQRCLEKDPRKRLRDIGEARLTLESVRSEARAARPEAVAGPLKVLTRGRDAMRNNGFLFAAGLVLGALLGINMLHSGGPKAGSSPVVHATIPVPPDLIPGRAYLTPDGRYDVMLATPRGAPTDRRIYVRRMEQGGFEPLMGSEGSRGFSISPDSRWIAFGVPISPGSDQRRIVKVALDGSVPATPVMSLDPAWDPPPVWLPSGAFVFLTNGGRAVVRVGRDGASSKPIPIEPAEYQGTITLEHPLDDDAVFVATTSYMGTAFHFGIGVMDVRTGRVKLVVRDGAHPQYVPTGHLLYARSDVVYAAPFDRSRRSLRGEPVAIRGGLRTESSWAHAFFSISDNGLLETTTGGSPWAARRAIVVDAKGTVTEWAPDREAFENSVAASPDGTRFASMVASANALFEIWVSERGRPSSRRAIGQPGADVANPLWSRDGALLAYGQESFSPSNGIYVVNGSGGGTPRRIIRAGPKQWLVPMSWSPDGAWLLCMSTVLSRPQLYVARTDAPGGRPADAKPVFGGQAQYGGGAFSPDGRWIAYHSDESGRDEVYVIAWSGDEVSGDAVLVSDGGGTWPTWAPDGRTLYYLSPGRKVMSASIAAAQHFTAGVPRVAWNMDSLRVAGNLYDILPDGRLLAIQRAPGEDQVPDLDLTVNFFDELRQKLAAASKK